LQIKPDFAEAHTNLGVALSIQGKYDTAAKHFLEALRLMPDFGEVHGNLGSTLANQGKLQQAAAYYAEALRINPGDAKTRRKP
jgi:tetratricopeptide (TPR) repeat protein